VLGQNRGTQRHRPRRVDGDRELLGVMRKIVETFPRHGSERTHRVLTGPDAFGGWKVSFKRVHRIWKEEHMQVPQKQRKRRRLPGSSANGCVRHAHPSGRLETRCGGQDQQVDVTAAARRVGSRAEQFDGPRRDPIDRRYQRCRFGVVEPHDPQRSQVCERFFAGGGGRDGSGAGGGLSGPRIHCGLTGF
jgi:hypothetical protein